MERIETPGVDRARLEQESTFGLAKELIDRLSVLAKKEIELAKAEMKIDAERGKAAGKLGGVAAVCGIATLCCALIAAVWGLSYLLPGWLAALCLFGVFGGLSLLFVQLTIKRAKSAQPKRSIREAQATVRMFTGLGTHALLPRHP